MHSVNLKFVNVNFSYSPAADNIISSLNLHFPIGWTGIVGANGVGKSTLAKLAAGLLLPNSGSIVGLQFLNSFYCEQETESIPNEASEFLFSPDSRAGELCSILKIQNDWGTRWNTLSHGERKRFQIGIALWKDPDILILDEPANHLDLPTKQKILNAVLTYNGIGIVVSHDRDFLDKLCSACVFMKANSISYRVGNFSRGLEQEKIEDKNLEREYLNSREEYYRLKANTSMLREKENSRTKLLSKKNLSKNDHDKKGKIDLARLTGKDKNGMRKLKVLERRVENKKQEVENKYVKRNVSSGFQFHGEILLQGKLIQLSESNILLGQNRYLEIPDLFVLPKDKIRIVGENGTGKSSLLKKIFQDLTIGSDKVIYLPQEIDFLEWQSIDRQMKNLSKVELGELFSIVHRLGSDVEKLLYSNSPSPGEKRKLLIGLGLLKSPSLLLLDEPTNHLDMPSIECIEKAISEFSGCVIIISHDQRFVNNLTNIEWRITKQKEKSFLIECK